MKVKYVYMISLSLSLSLSRALSPSLARSLPYNSSNSSRLYQLPLGWAQAVILYLFVCLFTRTGRIRCVQVSVEIESAHAGGPTRPLRGG